MSELRLVECFNGTPITRLSWRNMLAYNLALARLNSFSGNIDCGKAQQLGITWEYRACEPEESEKKS